MRLLLALWFPVWLSSTPPAQTTRVFPGGVHFLVGTERGLYRQAHAGWSLILARGAILDLVHLPGGWLAAAEDGLFESRDGQSSPVRVSLGAGARARSLAVDSSGAVWVATDAGLYSRPAHGGSFELQTWLPTGAVRGVRAAGGALYVAAGRALWERAAGGGFDLKLRGLEPGWWELLAAERIDSGVLLAVPSGVWLLGSERVEAIALGAGELRSLTHRAGTLWLASDRGVLRIDAHGVGRPGGPVPELAVAGDAFDVVATERGVWIAMDRGVARMRSPLNTALPAAGPRAPALRRPGTGLDPSGLQRAVLEYQGLDPRGIDRIAERARDAAWWPQVRLSAGLDRDRGHDRDYDQSFSSGATHHLRDSSRTTDAAIGIDLQLTWELAKRAEPDDLIAVSRERRELIELRDQVLERVNRLYYERLKVLAQLAAADPEQRAALDLRARELGSQLDAWTGGHFSRRAARDGATTEWRQNP